MISTSPPAKRSSWFWVRIALVIVPINLGVWLVMITLPASSPAFDPLMVSFIALAALQVGFGVIAAYTGIRQAVRTRDGGIAAAVSGLLLACGGAVGGFFGAIAALFAFGGGGWGRPLRVRGRQLHPELRAGSDWTAGPRPDAEALDPATRRALEALWLHDAQKEHASVPAFARISWLLAAAGAPAELLAWCHRAALEEIEHAQVCFALAAGYGGRCHTVEPMPELLIGELGADGDVLCLLATESLADGCLLEDFNADIAAECAATCTEPATRRALEQIAREERSHAEFSWAVLRWTLDHAADRVGPALERALRRLDAYPRPTAVSRRARPLVQEADADRLRQHGRLPDARWRAAWAQRLAATRERAALLLPATTGARAAAS
ncbi:MAG: ferritin-like domain-containing protein [Planctomycetes bacterium]|nr:ferritin-like domain-containing protein [Planctomycetota bacterium]